MRRGGVFERKIHALVDALSNPIELMLTPGQDHDLACAEALIENADPDALIGDKAYDANPFVDTLTQREIAPVIPPKSNRTVQRACDFVLYCERNLIERLFNHLNTSAPSPRATTSLREISLPGYSWPRLQSCSTEDRP